MATKRLGRGLSSIIAGGGPDKKKEDKPAAPKKAAKGGGKKKAAKEDFDVPPPRASKAVAESSRRRTESGHPGEIAEGYREIPIDCVDQSPYQARQDFPDDRIKQLAESIRSEGLINPITVRVNGERYELIAGECRLRACRSIGMRKITAKVTTASDKSSAVMSLIENLQRRDLNAIEESLGYASLMQDFNLTQEEVSERVGKARSTVTNSLRLLSLNKECQGYLRQGLLTPGHARALLGLSSQEQQTLLARRIIEEKLSVREIEELVARNKGGVRSKRPERKVPEQELTAIRDLQERLSGKLQARVELRHHPKKGKLMIEYQGNEDLQRILELLGLES